MDIDNGAARGRRRDCAAEGDAGRAGARPDCKRK